MSVIAFKRYDNRIEVAADGICICDNDVVVSNNFKKIYQISFSLIIGVTGLADTTHMFKRFVEENKDFYESLDNVTDGLKKFKEFKEYLIDEFGMSEDTIKTSGSFVIINKHFFGAFHYDDNCSPYVSNELGDSGVVGACRTYVQALMDYGLSPQDAIAFTSKRYTSINDNITPMVIEL